MNTSVKILLVEDDEDDLFLTSRILRKAQISQVFHVGDGRVALDYLAGRGPFANRNVHPLPDVLLVDLKIPEINGHQVIEWVASRPELRALRCFVLSSSGEERDRARARAAGVAGYFVKPLMPHDLATIVGEPAAPEPRPAPSGPWDAR